MTRRPFDRGEVEDLGRDLDPTLADFDRYLADTAADPSGSFTDDVMTAIEHEPMPRRGPIGAVLAWLAAPGGSRRTTLLVATAAVAVLAVVALGRISDLLPSNVGNSPSPSIQASPSVEVTPSPEASPSPPSQRPSPRPSRSPKPSATASGSAEASDDHGGHGSDSPDASDDSSGPGGGGGSDGSSGSRGSGSGSGSGSDD